MDFSLNEEQRSLQETVKKFAKNELTEIAKKVELEDKAVDKSVLKKFICFSLTQDYFLLIIFRKLTNKIMICSLGTKIF